MDASKLKVRCGWEVILYSVQPEVNRIEGWIIDGAGNKINMVWDSKGIPLDKDKVPAYHYLELIL